MTPSPSPIFYLPFFILLLLLLLLSTPAIAAPGPVKKVRDGIAHYEKGDYPGAVAAFDEAGAARPDDPRIAFDRACAYAAVGKTQKAEELFQKAALAPEPKVAAGSRYNLGNLAAAKARGVFGAKPEEASSEARQEGLSLLRQAVAHYRDCLELDPAHADARHNLELIRLWIKQMEALWKNRDRKRQRDEMDLLEFLAMLDVRQRELRDDARRLAAEPDSPKQRQALAVLATSQQELAEEIGPLREKLAKACEVPGQPAAAGAASSPPAVNREALDLLGGLADRTRDAMRDAAERLADRQPARAVPSQARAVEELDQIYLAVAPFTHVLQRALKKQQGLVDEVEEVAGNAAFSKQFDHGEAAWDQGLVADSSEILPVKAKQELKQMEAGPKDGGSGTAAQSEEARRQCACVKKALQKAIDFGSQKLRRPAEEASTLLEAQKAAEALVQQKESLRLLQEIADELPKKKSQEQDQKQDQQQNQKSDQKQDQKEPQSGQKPKASKQEPSRQQAEEALKKVRQRQHYRREMERHLQQIIAQPAQPDKDW